MAGDSVFSHFVWLYGAAAPPGQETPMQTPAPAATEPPNLQSETLLFSRSAAGAQTADGFYSMQYNEDWTGCLMFSDYATQQTVPLCSQPNCEHDTASCTAWFGDPYNIPRILTNGEKLVYCYLGMSGMATEQAFLETAAMDGSARTTIYTFPANETLDEGACIDSNAVYVLTRLTQQGNAPSAKCRLLRIDLENHTAEELWSREQENGTNYFLAGSLNGWIVLKEIRAEATSAQDVSAQIQSQRHTLYLVSPVDGTVCKLYQWKQDSALEMPDGDELFLVTDNHILYALNDSGETAFLAQNEVLAPGNCSLQYADADALWVTSTQAQDGEIHLYRISRKDGAAVELQAEDAVIDILGRYQDMLFTKISAGRSLSQGQDARFAFLSADIAPGGTAINAGQMAFFSGAAG